MSQLTHLLTEAETLERNGEWNQAAILFEKALTLAPFEAEIWYRVGVCHVLSSDFEEALQFLDKATMLAPENAAYEQEKGDALQHLRRLREAVVAYNRALELDPENVTARTNLAIALREGGHPGEAFANLEIALELAPDDPIVRLNFGSALMQKGDIDGAQQNFRAATELAPEYAAAWSNLGFALQEMRNYDAALVAHRRALELDMESPGIHWNHAMTRLLLGDYSNGFAEFEYRRGMPDRKPRDFPGPEWRGEPLVGKTILIHAEQGLGDTLQFARFVIPVARSGARVVFAVHSALAELISNMPEVAEVVAGAASPPAYDYQVPLLSLPHKLGLSMPSISGHPPYLQAPRELDAPLPVATTTRRFGLVWAGNPDHANDHNRSCPLETLLPLVSIPDTEWFSLQVGPPSERLSEMDANISDMSFALTDFSVTAATIAKLDIVISVDTAVAHLAGAMGRPVWILLPFAPDWRWMADRKDSPWYPTAKLFRQKRPGDWKSVVAEVQGAIGKLPRLRARST